MKRLFSAIQTGEIMRLKDLTGQRFGRWLVLREAGVDKYGKVQWLCKCDCGNECIVRQRNLLGARVTKSCGCLRKIDAFLATNGVKTLTEGYLCSFDDFDKFLFIHRSLIRTVNLSNIDINKYTDYIESAR